MEAIEQLKIANKECEAKIAEASDRADNVIASDAERVHNGVYDNIPKQFGEYLNICLGDKINSVRSSVLNKTYFESDNPSSRGSRIKELAKEKNMDVEAFVQKEVKDSYWSNGNPDTIYITTGKSFGVSYFAGSGERTHTMYFAPKKYYQFLTQEHIDQIKNKRKRECGQAFLDFRDEFAKSVEDVDAYKKINLTAKIGTILECSIHNKYDRYGKDSSSYEIFTDVKDRNIKYVAVYIPDFPAIWDKQHNVSKDCKYGRETAESLVGVSFFDFKEDSNSRQITNVGSVDFAVDKSFHSLSAESYDGHSPNNDKYRGVSTKIRNDLGWSYSVRTENVNGLLMNLDELMQNPEVKSMIDARIKILADASTKLLELKEEFADLYFVNSESI